MISIFIYVGVEVGIPNIANLYMTSPGEAGGLGFDPSIAGTVVGTYWFLMLVGRFTGGILGSKLSSKTMLTGVSLLALVFVTLALFLPSETMINMPVFQSDISFGFAQVPVGIFFLVLVGLCTSVMWGSIFNLATSGLGKYTAAASGLFMVMVCGGGILPAIQGGVADAAGFINSYWIVFAGLAFILFYALAGHKNVNKNIPTV
jgi:FHS family L-fucose permease-like MFS transporter